jgi:uncharacterized membrane protein YozB (DUF420 family)
MFCGCGERWISSRVDDAAHEVAASGKKTDLPPLENRIARSHVGGLVHVLTSTPSGHAAKVVFVLTMALGAATVAFTSLPYFFGDELHPFILEKLPVLYEDVWMLALLAHVASAVFALPACLVLLSRTVLRRFPALHRNLGRLTAVVILTALVPSGLYLALFAKGGGIVTAGFALSAFIVVIAMLHGVRTAWRREVRAHRNAMAHVTAQLSVAVTSRLMLVGLDMAGVTPETAYIVALWIPVVVSAVCVEFVVPRPRAAARHIERSPRAHRSFARVVVHPLR